MLRACHAQMGEHKHFNQAPRGEDGEREEAGVRAHVSYPLGLWEGQGLVDLKDQWDPDR